MHTESVEAVNWWARPRGEQSGAWIANYQKSLGLRHRVAISQIVKELKPKTLLEIGCHCGPNLIRLATDHPTLKIAGLDASPEAIAAGQQWAIKAGFEGRVECAVGRFPLATEKFPTGAFDVVLSCYTLAYISPADLDAALYELGRIAKRAVILAEPQVFEEPVSHRHAMSGYSEWHHDYQRARSWTKTLRDHRSRVVPVAPPVDALNAILVLES